MASRTAEWCWVDGRWVRWQDATVHLTAHALHYGSSVFEGVRAYETQRSPAVFRLSCHIQRLRDSCRMFHMELPEEVMEGFEQACIEIIERNRHRSCYLRPLIFRGEGSLGLDPRKNPIRMAILSLEWGNLLGSEAIENGVDVAVSSWRRASPDASLPLGKIGGQYVINQLAAMEARENGFEEAILLDGGGYVAEGAGENLFGVVDGELVTPPSDGSILEGITRDSVVQLAADLGLRVRCERFSRDRLYLFDELFMTGTAAEITPLRSVDRVQIGDGRPGPITRRIQEEFFGIVQGRRPDRHGWLQYVNPALAASVA